MVIEVGGEYIGDSVGGKDVDDEVAEDGAEAGVGKGCKVECLWIFMEEPDVGVDDEVGSAVVGVGLVQVWADVPWVAAPD